MDLRNSPLLKAKKIMPRKYRKGFHRVLMMYYAVRANHHHALRVASIFWSKEHLVLTSLTFGNSKFPSHFFICWIRSWSKKKTKKKMVCPTKRCFVFSLVYFWRRRKITKPNRLFTTKGNCYIVVLLFFVVYDNQ